MAASRNGNALRERSLYGFLLLCMLASAIVMALVLREIVSVREHSLDAGPGGFHNVIKLQNLASTYSSSLVKYRQSMGNAEQMQFWSTEYLRIYNILYSAFDNIYIDFPRNSEHQEAVLQLKHDSAEFLRMSDPLMQPNMLIGKEDTTNLLTAIENLQQQLHQNGANYFNYTAVYRDNWVDKLNRLQTLLWFFTACLIAAAGSLVGLLIRSNSRKNMLVKEAETAKLALSTTVEELRSGKLEQRAKDSFIAAASHDLRQPLHALGLFLGSLESHIDSSEGRNTLEAANRCSNNVGDLFNSLLDISRLDAGVVEVNKKHFRLLPLMQMLEQEFRAKANSKNISLKLDIRDLIVYTDPILLSRIVRNLIENALLHSQASEILIQFRERNYCLVVEDNGRGIPPHEQQQVFKEYYQLDSRSVGSGKGLGLGLSIVQRMADLLDVPVTMNSVPTSHTRFEMTLPAGDVEKVIDRDLAQQVSEDLVRASSGMTVCVIDDEENILSAMSLMLTQMGLKTIAARNADKAIDKCVESDVLPDLIVADYRLEKGHTGDQAIVQIRRALNTNVPGMLVTGDTSPVHVAEATKSGFVLLHKPVQPAELATRIAELLVATKSEQTPADNDKLHA